MICAGIERADGADSSRPPSQVALQACFKSGRAISSLASRQLSLREANEGTIAPEKGWREVEDGLRPDCAGKYFHPTGCVSSGALILQRTRGSCSIVVQQLWARWLSSSSFNRCDTASAGSRRNPPFVHFSACGVSPHGKLLDGFSCWSSQDTLTRGFTSGGWLAIVFNSVRMAPVIRPPACQHPAQKGPSMVRWSHTMRTLTVPSLLIRSVEECCGHAMG